MKFVIDPTDSNGCYGKYEMSNKNIPEDWDNIVEVGDLDEFEVIDWSYEDW